MDETHEISLDSSVQKRIPAWQRIGLKLARKSIPKEEPPENETKKALEILKEVYGAHENDPSPTVSPDPISSAKKRKFASPSEDTKFKDDSQSKIRRKHLTIITGGKLAKSEDTYATIRNPPLKPGNHQQHVYLEYLFKYYTDRSNWKFNKSIQTSILKHVFDTHRIPEEYDDALHSYLQGLQGSEARRRLAEQTHQILSETMDEYNDKEGEIRAAKARSQALKQQLFEEKVRMREEDDEHELETDEFQQKAAKRKRATKIAAWMEELWSTRRVPHDLVFEERKVRSPMELGGPINSVFSLMEAGPDEADGQPRGIKRKKVTVRLRKARTGFTQDDVESVSSVNSDYVAQLLGEKSDEESSNSSSSTSSEDTDEDVTESSEEDTEDSESSDETNNSNDEESESDEDSDKQSE